MRYIVNHYLSGEESKQFVNWAFGPDFLTFSTCVQFMDKWNDLHGDLLTLNEAGIIEQDIPKMIKIWKDNR